MATFSAINAPEWKPEMKRGFVCQWRTVIRQGWHKHLQSMVFRGASRTPKEIELALEVYALSTDMDYPIERHIACVSACPRLSELTVDVSPVLLVRNRYIISFMKGLLPLFRNIKLLLRPMEDVLFAPWASILLDITHTLDTRLTLEYHQHIGFKDHVMMDKALMLSTIKRLPWVSQLCLFNIPCVFLQAELYDTEYSDHPRFFEELKDTPITDLDYHMLPKEMVETTSLDMVEDELWDLPLTTLRIHEAEDRTIEEFWNDYKSYAISDSALSNACQELHVTASTITSDFCIEILGSFPALKTLHCKQFQLKDKDTFIAAVMKHKFFYHLQPCPPGLESFFERRKKLVEREAYALFDSALPIEVTDLKELVHRYGGWI